MTNAEWYKQLWIESASAARVILELQRDVMAAGEVEMMDDVTEGLEIVNNLCEWFESMAEYVDQRPEAKL